MTARLACAAGEDDSFGRHVSLPMFLQRALLLKRSGAGSSYRA
jgi:hypothetical protein